ncbi:MAG: PD40 domain-containing protein [Kiritimatiellae bacterium]|nr:PD40 domain-containing protein [Kiritimatiellia bacterium]
MRRWTLFLLAVACTAQVAVAQVRVTKSAGEKSAINMASFTAPSGAALLFRQTLESDLRRSGWFAPVRGAGEFRLLGSAEDRGGSLRVECEVYGTADQRRYFGKSYSEQAAAARTLAHRVADEIVAAVAGRRGIASTRIAMIGTRSGAKEIYLCDADGGGLIQLTRDKVVSIAPKWGPQADRIVYTSFLKRFPDVYQIVLATGNREQIAGYPGLNTGADISPDGRDIALILSKDGNPDLYIKSLRGGQLTRVTRTPNAAEASPTWSPDGSRIAYVSDTSGTPQVYVVSRGGGAPRRLTARGSENVAPDWGPGGLIACASRVGGRYEIIVVSPDTGEVKPLGADYADYEDPSWAPDGRHIACTRTQSYRAKVYILDTLGDPPVALTDYEGDWYSPAWSPE